MKTLLKTVAKSALQSVFGEACGLYQKCQLKSLLLGLFLVRFQAFTRNGSDKVCDRVCFQLQVFLFVKLQTFTVNGSDRICDRICFYKTQTLKMSAMESVLVKLQVITMNGNAQVCGRFCYKRCFQFKAATKASVLYYEW